MTHMLGPQTELGWSVSTQGHAHLISGHLKALKLLALLLCVLRPPGAAACRTATLCLLLSICRC